MKLTIPFLGTPSGTVKIKWTKRAPGLLEIKITKKEFKTYAHTLLTLQQTASIRDMVADYTMLKTGITFENMTPGQMIRVLALWLRTPNEIATPEVLAYVKAHIPEVIHDTVVWLGNPHAEAIKPIALQVKPIKIKS